MMKLSWVFMCCLSFPRLIANERAISQFIAWNVGQGQWLTYVNENYCLHFDMGGEKAPLLAIQKLCYQKRNVLYLSHWDTDHISFIQKFRTRVFYFCLAGKPQMPRKGWKANFSKLLPDCLDAPTQLVSEIFSGSGKHANSSSRVFLLKPMQIAIPGDSTVTEEKAWGPLMPRTVHGLILGHHGSRTSTGHQLLKDHRSLKWSIASAKKSRYGHPHKEVLQRLNENQIIVLRTEDWGNIKMLAPLISRAP